MGNSNVRLSKEYSETGDKALALVEKIALAVPTDAMRAFPTPHTALPSSWYETCEGIRRQFSNF